MAASAARNFLRSSASKSLLEGLKCSKSLSVSSNLTNVLKGKSLSSSALKTRCLSQLLPSLVVQGRNNLPITAAVESLLEGGFISKSTALRLAISESEITSTEESDEEDEAMVSQVIRKVVATEPLNP